MDMTPSFSKNIQESPSGVSANLEHVGQVLMPPGAPIRATLREAHIALTVTIKPGDPPRVAAVVLEALTSAGESVVTFQSYGRIHNAVSNDILRVLKKGGVMGHVSQVMTSDGPLSEEDLLNAIEQPRKPGEVALMARNIYHLLSEHSPMEWETIPTASPGVGCNGLVPVWPTLQQFVHEPSIVDRQFSSKRVTPEGVERLSAALHPDQGYLVLTTHYTAFEGENTVSRCWKVLAPATTDNSPSERGVVLAQYMRRLNAVFQDGGCEEVAARLLIGDEEAILVPATPMGRINRDNRLSRGLFDVDRNEGLVVLRKLSSQAVVGLAVGTRYAAIGIRPSLDSTSHQHVVVFYCSDSFRELTTRQIRHIKSLYALLTSESHSDRARGVQLCGLGTSTKVPPAGTYEQQPGSVDGEYAISKLSLSLLATAPNATELLGPYDTERLFAIRGISLEVSQPSWVSDAETYLDGGRNMTIRLSASNLQLKRPELFHTMKLRVLNDGALDVFLENHLGGQYRATVPGSSSEAAALRGEVILDLCERFSRQASESWTPLIAEIERLSGESERDSELQPWEPGYGELPPLADTQAIAMFQEAAKICSWVASGFASNFPRGLVRYQSPSAVELVVAKGETLPAFCFRLDNGILRECIVVRENAWRDSNTAHSEPILRYRSDTLGVHSDEAEQVVEAFVEAIQRFPGSMIYTYSESQRASALEALDASLSRLMTKVQ